MEIIAPLLTLTLLLTPVARAVPANADTLLLRELSLVRLEEAQSPQPTLIGHRGLSALAPENSRPALELAAGYGLDGAEFDVYPTSDGVWVLSHDPTVDAMTAGTGAIMDMTYAQLSQLTLDAGSNVASYPGLGLCTLAEALDCCAEGGITPYIEIKGGSWSQLDGLVELIRQKNMLEQVVILSYGYDILQYLRTGGDVIPLYWLVSRVDDRTIALAKALPNTGLDFWLADGGNTPEAIAKARAAGVPLIAWVADSQDAVDRLVSLGVTAITTNRLVPALNLPEPPQIVSGL